MRRRWLLDLDREVRRRYRGLLADAGFELRRVVPRRSSTSLGVLEATVVGSTR